MLFSLFFILILPLLTHEREKEWRELRKNRETPKIMGWGRNEGCTSQVFLLLLLSSWFFHQPIFSFDEKETNSHSLKLSFSIHPIPLTPGISASCDFFSVFHRWWCDIIIGNGVCVCVCVRKTKVMALNWWCVPFSPSHNARFFLLPQ